MTNFFFKVTKCNLNTSRQIRKNNDANTKAFKLEKKITINNKVDQKWMNLWELGSNNSNNETVYIYYTNFQTIHLQHLIHISRKVINLRCCKKKNTLINEDLPWILRKFGNFIIYSKREKNWSSWVLFNVKLFCALFHDQLFIQLPHQAVLIN